MPPPTPQPGARILLLDPDDRVLLLHIRDPSQPARTWWELPGGSRTGEETAVDAGRRELAEETGIYLDREHIHRCVWVRESRYLWDDREHHRLDEIYLARLPGQLLRQPVRRDELEQCTIIEKRWWSLPELQATTQRFLPEQLPALLADLLAGNHPGPPVRLREDTRSDPGGQSR